LNSAFVHFNHRLSIPLAVLTLKTRSPPSWTVKRGTAHDDIIWPNLAISWWEQCIRASIVYFLLVVLVLGFALPVTITGVLSQIAYLIGVIPALASVERLPNWILGIIQGVLPPMILMLLTVMVPPALRVLANLQGLYSRQAVENSVQLYYFIFLFVQVFLVVSLSASITTVIEELLSRVESVPVVLAQNLPKASNYFFSYFIIQASSTVTITLLHGNELFNFVLSRILDKTARQKWTRSESVHLKSWGTFIPVYTNLACIGMSLPQLSWPILNYSLCRSRLLCDCSSHFGIQYRSLRDALDSVSELPP